MKNYSISAIIITLNEESNIRECLESIKWVDEIIVLDSGSTDKTVAIAREFTDKVFETDWPGFGPQKNRALEIATGSWVLSIDADERITNDLKNEILESVSSTRYNTFDMPRLSLLCGKSIKHSGWWPDRVVRLFQKGRARFSDSLVHERILVDGNTGHLQSHLLHYSFNSLEQLVEKMNRYSTYGATQRFNEGKSSGLLKAILRGFWMFLRTYVFKLGFLDGREGFVIAVSSAESTYYRYLKLMYLHK